MANAPRRMPPSQPSQAEMEARMSAISANDPRNRVYGFDVGQVEEAHQLTRQSRVTPKGTPRQGMSPNPDVIDESFAAGLPITANNRGEFARTSTFDSTMRRYGAQSFVTEAYSILEDRPEAANYGYDVTSGTYYDPTEYANLANLWNPGNARNNVAGPAPLTVRPTATTNPRRPRTVAAGYDYDRKTLTVVFRDGTFYNYYEVGTAAWNGFKLAPSKGAYIRKYLDQKPRGYAEMSYISDQAQELIYRVTRTNQQLFNGEQSLRPTKQPAQRTKATPRTRGTNPSRGGKAPTKQRRKP